MINLTALHLTAEISPGFTCTDCNGNVSTGSSVLMTRNLLGDKRPVVVLGAPRQADKGAVIIFEMDQLSQALELRETILGEQFASGFGHSTAAVDIKGDG